jgi:hypothetical protein
MSPDSVSSKTGFQTSAAELDRTCRRNARIVYALEALRRVVIFCLAQFLFRHDALVRLNQAFDFVLTSTVFFRQHGSYLVYAGRGVARECGAPKVNGLPDVELMRCHGRGE